MSRGHGKTQRFVLERLERSREEGVQPWDRWLTAAELAHERACGEPTKAEVESVRRALRRLAEEGLVETGHVDDRRLGEERTETVRKWDEEAGEFTDELEEWTYTPLHGYRVLRARLALSDEEQEAERRHKEERRAAVRARLAEALSGKDRSNA